MSALLHNINNCKCKDCKTPHNKCNGGCCDKCASPVEEAKTATHDDAESDSDSEEELELQFIGNKIDLSCFDDID